MIKIRNCIILGSGRSGTSMMAGVLNKVGYFMGDRLYPGDEGNPKGYFEDPEINGVNEELLAQVLPARPPGIVGNLFFRSRLSYGQRWLANLPLGISIPCSYDLAVRIKNLSSHEPFCFKDPRFSYTLPVWRPYLRNPVFICVFRHPSKTATSIVTECRREKYLHNLSMNFDKALQVWEAMYSHILDKHHRVGEEWLFVHYNQFLDGSVAYKLEKALGVTVDCSFVDPKLKRSTTMETIPIRTLSIYQRLCNLAGYIEEQ